MNLLVTELSRVFVMPEDVPADVTQYWQSAFDQIDGRLRAFKEQVAIAGYEEAYGYGRAEDIRDIIDRVQSASQATRDVALGLSGVGNLTVN